MSPEQRTGGENIYARRVSSRVSRRALLKGLRGIERGSSLFFHAWSTRFLPLPRNVGLAAGSRRREPIPELGDGPRRGHGLIDTGLRWVHGRSYIPTGRSARCC